MARKFTFRWPFSFRRKQKTQDFKPDANPATFAKTARLTRLQKQQLGKWGLYAAVLVLCQVVQDVIMSQFRLFGATTDLTVCAIVLIALLEGAERGSLFLLIASVLYYFSGTAPTPYTVGLITFLGTGACLLRQGLLHRSRGSIVLCGGVTLVAYELGLYVVGVMSGLTLWTRLPVFLFTGLYSALCLIPMYNPVCKISMIGGESWRE